MEYQNDITLKDTGGNDGPSISFPHASFAASAHILSLSLRPECVFGELRSAFENILTFLRMLA